MKVREAGSGDLEAITEIYNDAVENTTAIWNDERVDTGNRSEWLAQHQQAGYPVLVATTDDDQAVAYATFGDWRAWDGYRHTVEHSIYVRFDQRRNGIGELLLRALIDRATNLGKHVMVAGIEASNHGSVALHAKLGFHTAGTLTEVGAKFGTWLDLTFMQLTLDNRATPNN